MAITDYDWVSQKNAIIQRAFRIIGKLTEGETLSGYQYDQAGQALNDYVKWLQSKTIYLWTLKPISIPLVAATSSYTFSALGTPEGIMGVDAAYYRDSTNADVRLDLVSMREYYDLVRKTTTGTPQVVAFDGKTDPSIYVWPLMSAPTASDKLYVIGVQKLADWDTTTSTGDFPVRFIEPLTYGLAARLADEYGLNIADRGFFHNKAEEFFSAAKRMDQDWTDGDSVVSAFRS